MIYLILILLSALSSLLFKILNIKSIIIQIYTLQKDSFSILKNNSFTDDEKQKILLRNSRKLFNYSILLLMKFSLIFIPISLFFIVDYCQKTNYAQILVKWDGILFSTFSFVILLLILNKYDSRRLQ